MSEIDDAYESLVIREDLAAALRTDRIRILAERVRDEGGLAAVTHDGLNDKVAFAWPGDARLVRIPADQFLKFFDRECHRRSA